MSWRSNQRMPLVKTTACDLADDPLVAVMYAAPGVGKTHSITSLIEEGKEDEVLIVDIDKSSRVIRNVRPNAHIVRIETFADLDELYKNLKTNHPDWKSYKTVVFDTLTNGEQILLWDIMKAKGKHIPTIDNYGERSSRIRQFVQEWRDLDRNVIFVCHERESDVREETPDGEEVMLTRKMPEMSGKMAILLCGDVDMVLRLCIREQITRTGKKKVTRVFQTFKTNTVFAKDRSGELERFESCNLRNVFKKWYGLKVKDEPIREESTEEKPVVNG